MAYKAVYDRKIFYSPDSGYSVIQYKTEDNIPLEARTQYIGKNNEITRFTAVGYGMPQTDAVEVMLEGDWEKGKHGLQLIITNWEEIIPQTAEGVQAYLSSGIIKGIGEKTAEDIVKQFGIKALQILEKEPEKLLIVKGITESKLEAIKESYALSRPISGLMTFLAPYDITPYKAMKIQQSFGTNSLSIIKTSPFKLCKIPGFGFVTVDTIAMKIGCKPNDPLRIRGALFYALEESRSNEGHLCLEREDLCKKALKLLNKRLPKNKYLIKDEVNNELNLVISENELISNYNSVYLPNCYLNEGIVAKRVATRLMTSTPIYDISILLKNLSDKIGISLSHEQEQAVKTALNSNMSIITGPPGTGKTTVLKAIIYVYQTLFPGKSILLTAPTGRASRRMAESTGFQNAKTLHSALGLVSQDVNVKLRNDDLVDADFIIVDETSMVDMWLCLQLFNRLRPDTKLLMIGDPEQLPSVGAGNVFREFINCELIPIARLSQIFRQSNQSTIPFNARLINQGIKNLDYNNNDFIFRECEIPTDIPTMIYKIYLDEISRKGLENVQILSPMKERGDASSEKLNMAIQDIVNPASPNKPELKVNKKIFRLGDRVMQTKNKDEITNGDVGIIVSIDNGKVLINFSDPFKKRYISYDKIGMETIELAYAITIHSARRSLLKR